MDDISVSALPEIEVDRLVSYLENAPIRLAVFGEFSAGKTTVLNALIGEEILSVAVDPTTAVPTRIRYGREFNISVDREVGDRLHLFDDDPPFWTRFVGRRDVLSTLQKQQSTIQDFLWKWTKEGERADEVTRVIIELPLNWLKGGLELVDTPGVNNEFVRHQGFTEQEAGEADIAVLLMDARQGGGKRTEFEFMNDVQRQVGRCLVAPNKMDLVPADEREEFLGYIRETALPKHWEGAVTPPVMGISALAALHPEEHDEPGLVTAFDDLRERLEQVAEEERGKLLLARKGNPEKQLFARAKELEGEKKYDRAHRLYFDLLDVLNAAGLEPTPAEEGIARCEENLTVQVDALDELNERYNEALSIAEDDPDTAVQRLRAIRNEKDDLRLEDGDLQMSIETLEERIAARDAARAQIQETKALIEQNRHNDEWIDAATKAKRILQLTDEAELTMEEEEALRNFVEKQVQDRNEWAEAHWRLVKEEIDSRVNDNQYLAALEHLDALEEVVQYTSFEEETEEIVEYVRERAETQHTYLEAVREAFSKAQVLRRNRVEPDDGRALEDAIQEVWDVYRSLYGVPDLPDREPIDDSSISLTIDQKLGLALQLKILVEPSPDADEAAKLAKEIRSRRREIRDTATDDEDRALALVDKYPDHPEAKAALHALLNERLPFWALPSQIQERRSAIEKYQDVLPEKPVEERLQQLDKRVNFFKWQGEDTGVALLLVFIGGFFATNAYVLKNIEAELTLLVIAMGLISITGGAYIQYYQPSSEINEQY